VSKLIPNNYLAIYEVMVAFACFAAIPFLLYLSKRDLKKFYCSVTRTTLLLLAIIVISGFFIRVGLSPFGENKDAVSWEYMANGYLISEGKISAMHYERGPAYPVFLSIFYVIFPVSEQTTYWLNVCLGSLSILLVFSVTQAMFRKEKISLISSVLVAINHELIFWDGTGHANSLLISFLLLSMFTMVLYVRTKSKPLFFLSFVFFVYLTLIRYETLLIAIFGLSVIIYRIVKTKEISVRVLLFLIVFLFVATIPSMIHIRGNLEQIGKEDSIEGMTTLSYNAIKYNMFEVIHYYYLYFKELSILGPIVIAGILLFIILLAKKGGYPSPFGLLILLILLFLHHMPYVLVKTIPRYLAMAQILFIILISVFAFIIFNTLYRVMSTYVASERLLKLTLFIFIVSLFSLTFCYSFENIQSVKDYRLKKDMVSLTETMETLRDIDKNAYVIMAGNEARAMLLMAKNQNHLAYEILDLEYVRNLLNNSREVYLLISVSDFDDELNFIPYYYNTNNEKTNIGMILNNSFELKIVATKDEIILYQLLLKQSEQHAPSG